MPKPQRADDGGRSERRRAVNDYRREIILAAARRIFRDQGLEGASLRAIAKEAGYTHGALYVSYASKEEISGDLLAGSLDRLQAAVRTKVAGSWRRAKRLRSAALAFFDYYRDNPGDLDLGFYLFHGMKPLGLTRELNADLNGRLLAALGEVDRAHSRRSRPPAGSGRARDGGALRPCGRPAPACPYRPHAAVPLRRPRAHGRLCRPSGRAARLYASAILIRPPAVRRNEESKSHQRGFCFLRRSVPLGRSWQLSARTAREKACRSLTQMCSASHRHRRCAASRAFEEISNA
jgi:AcrR family transcriptional regulator